jgi:flagellar hook-associated protein 3 FlgL
MRMTSQIGDIDQYRRNGTFATTKLSTEDVAISSLRDAISKAKQLALSNTSSDPNDPIRLAALNEAKSLKDQMVALGNTQVGDQYIFGGDYSTAPPFQSNGAYVGNLSPQQVEISSGVTISVNHAGQPLFTDALSAIDNLITQLGSGTPDQINAAATTLSSAGDTALGLQAEVGSRLQDIQTASTNLAAQSSSLMDRRDSLSTVDQATAIVDLQNEQTALERAYAVVGRVMQSSLTDYLK